MFKNLHSLDIRDNFPQKICCTTFLQNIGKFIKDLPIQSLKMTLDQHSDNVDNIIDQIKQNIFDPKESTLTTFLCECHNNFIPFNNLLNSLPKNHKISFLQGQISCDDLVSVSQSLSNSRLSHIVLSFPLEEEDEDDDEDDDDDEDEESDDSNSSFENESNQQNPKEKESQNSESPLVSDMLNQSPKTSSNLPITFLKLHITEEEQEENFVYIILSQSKRPIKTLHIADGSLFQLDTCHLSKRLQFDINKLILTSIEIIQDEIFDIGLFGSLHLETLVIDNSFYSQNVDFTNLFSKCPNLRTLILDTQFMKPQIIDTVFQKSQNALSLEIFSCSSAPNLDVLLSFLKTPPAKLKFLQIAIHPHQSTKPSLIQSLFQQETGISYINVMGFSCTSLELKNIIASKCNKTHITLSLTRLTDSSSSHPSDFNSNPECRVLFAKTLIHWAM